MLRRVAMEARWPRPGRVRRLLEPSPHPAPGHLQLGTARTQALSGTEAEWTRQRPPAPARTAPPPCRSPPGRSRRSEEASGGAGGLPQGCSSTRRCKSVGRSQPRPRPGRAHLLPRCALGRKRETPAGVLQHLPPALDACRWTNRRRFPNAHKGIHQECHSPALPSPQRLSVAPITPSRRTHNEPQ